MSKDAGSAGANTGLIVGAVILAAAAVGTGIYIGGQQPTEPSEVGQPLAQEQPAPSDAEPAVVSRETVEQEAVDQTPVEQQAVDQTPVQQEPSAQEPSAEETAAQEAETAPTPPTIDEVRVEEDGLTIVAGRAAPGSVISIQLDGVETTTVNVDASGSFAAITTLEPDEDARVLSLVQKEGEDEVASLDEVILAPVIVPVVRAEPDVEVAAVTPTPEVNAPAAEVAAAEPETATEAVAEAEPVTPEANEDADKVASGAPSDTDEASPSDSQVADASVLEQPAELPAEQTTEQVAEVTEEQAVETATEQVAEVPSDQIPQLQTDVTDLAGVNPADVDVANANGTTDSKPALDGPQTALTALEPGLAIEPNVDTTEADPLPELPVTATTSVASVDTPAVTGEESPASVQNIEQPQPAVAQAQAELTNETTADPVPQGTTDTPGRVAVLRSTQEGVELLGRQAVIQDNVALDTISYSAEGAVQLAGRAKRTSEAVRIYLNNKPIVTLEVDPDGRWRGDLPEVDSGVYTLRVDEVAADGAVTSRIQTPFQREDPAALDAAREQDGNKTAKRVTVQAGDTLWAISRERYGEGLLYVQVFEANRGSIRNPNLIFPGQVFDLPE